MPWPNGSNTQPSVSSGFGPRSGGAFSFHYGVDLVGFTATYAPFGGRITFAGWANNAAGNTIYLDLGAGVVLVFMHLAGFNVSRGAVVGAGARIGTAGSSGNATGVCLHYEVRVNGTSVEPLAWTRDRLGGSVAGGAAGQWPARDLYGADWVISAQGKLQRLGLYSGDLDGQDGPGTQSGTKVLQNAGGLDADGVFGPLTNALADLILAGRNATSRAVSEIQAKVGATPDNIWGGMTSFAVYKWQRANGLEADAVWGPVSDAKAFTVVTPNPPTTPTIVGRNTTARATAEIQRFLNVDHDGAYGPGTTAAVIAFQTVKGLEADGVWGADTDGIAFARVPEMTSATSAVTVSCGTARAAGAFIGKLNVHHTATTADQRAYFAGVNDRKSCPTIYIKDDGRRILFIPPKLQPWSTGSADVNAIAVEIQNTAGEPDWRISAKAEAALVDVLVELATADTIDGLPVRFTLDRDHVVLDRETRATACPGQYVTDHIDEYLARARAIVDAATPDPVPVPVPDTVAVDRSWLQSVFDKLKQILGGSS
jgi:peptidoglycan hydrolase-like protein with peptidoglycan-binding domain